MVDTHEGIELRWICAMQTDSTELAATAGLLHADDSGAHDGAFLFRWATYAASVG
jgi:hypothetical protein